MIKTDNFYISSMSFDHILPISESNLPSLGCISEKELQDI